MNTLIKVVNIIHSDLEYCERSHYLTYKDIDNWYNQDVGIMRCAVLFLSAMEREQAAIYLLNYCQRNIWKRYKKLLDANKPLSIDKAN